MSPPLTVMRDRLGSSLPGRTSHTNFVWQISPLLCTGMSSLQVTPNVLVPLTCCCWGPAVPCPTPWYNLPNSLHYEVFQVSLDLGWVRIFLNSKFLPVSLSMTDIAAKSGVSGVHHRSMSSLGYLRWEDRAGLIVRPSSMFLERVRCATGSSGGVVGFTVLDVWRD